MKIHHLTAHEALKSLHTGPDGLSEVEAARRLREFGPNRVEQGTPLPLRFLQEFTHLFAVILWLAAGFAFIAEASDPGQGMATLGYAILGVILVNSLFSFWQEYRAEKAMEALQRLLPYRVEVLREGRVRQVLAATLAPGDILLLQEGDDIPADCRLIETFGVRVNNATVTGESLPQGRDAGPCQEEDVLHGRNPAWQEYRASRHIDGGRRCQGRGVRHRGAYRVRDNCPSHADRGRAALTTAARDRPSEPPGSAARHGAGCRVLRHRSGDRPFLLGELHLRHPASLSRTYRRGCCRRLPWRSPWRPSAWRPAMHSSATCRR